MIDRDVALILVGAGIALVSSVVTIIMGHWLSLREDRIKRERDKKERFNIDVASFTADRIMVERETKARLRREVKIEEMAEEVAEEEAIEVVAEEEIG